MQQGEPLTVDSITTGRRGVSILTRSSDRMQREGRECSVGVLSRMFQSSPGRLTGCNATKAEFIAAVMNKFQSSPGRLTGCNLVA